MKTLRIKGIVGFTLLFAVVGVVSATDYYVATNGNNSWNGLSPDSAWKTIAYAVGNSSSVSEGDTIYILDGYYPEGSKNVYFAKDDITLTAYNQGSPNVVVDGITNNPNDWVFRILNRNNINISKLEIKNGDNCIDVRTSTNIHISDCVIHDSNGEGIVIYDDSHYCSVDNCTMYSCGWNIMMLGGRNDQPNQDFSSHLSVTNCEIYSGIEHNLLDLSGDMEYIDIIGNYLHDGDHGSFYTHQEYPDGIGYLNFSDNIISGGLDAIHFDTPCYNSSIINNIINQNNPSGMIVQFREGINNVTFRDNYIRGDVSSQMLFVDGVAGNNLFDHNDVKSDYGDTEYYIRGSGNATIRNEIGLSYKVASSESGYLTVEYTDGKVFSENGSGNPFWFATGSRYQFISGVVTISTYNMMVLPSTDSLEVLVITWDTTGTYYKNWQEICENSSVATSHAVGDFPEYAHVKVDVDGVLYGMYWADSSGWISFDYTAGFVQDTVNFEVYVIAGIDKQSSKIAPWVISLQVNPNPFRQMTEIRFSIPQGAESMVQGAEGIELKIYDISGKLVKSFSLTTDHSALFTAVSWDGTDDSGNKVPSGVYFCRLTVDDNREVKKVLFLR